MTYLLIAVAVMVFCFGFVLAFGAPYLPTLGKQVTVGLDLLDLKPGFSDRRYQYGCQTSLAGAVG